MAWGKADPGDVSDLVRMISKNEVPELIVMPMRNLNDKGAVALAGAVDASSALETLDVIANDVTVEGSSALLKAVLASASVKEFRIVVEKVDEDMGAAWSAIITEAATAAAGKGTLLKSLSFHGSRMSCGALEALAGALAGGVPGCDEPTPIAAQLMFSECAGTDTAWSALAAACAATGVTSLRLHSVVLGDAGLGAFACLAEPPSKLETFSVTQSQLGAVVDGAVGTSGMTSAEYATMASKEPSAGVEFDPLFNADLGSYERQEVPGAAEALRSLCELETLSILDVGMSRMSASEQVAAMEGLVSRSRKPSAWGKAVSLSLSSCRLGDEGILAIANVAASAVAASGDVVADGGAAVAGAEGLDVATAQIYGLGVQLLLSGNDAASAGVCRLAEVWEAQVRAAMASGSHADAAAAGAAGPRLLFRTVNVGSSTTVGTEAATALVRAAGLALGQAHLMGGLTCDAEPDEPKVAEADEPVPAGAAAAAAATAGEEGDEDKPTKVGSLPADKVSELATATAAAIARFQGVLPAGSSFGPDLRLSRAPMGGTGPGVDLSACCLTEQAGVAIVSAVAAATKPWSVSGRDFMMQVAKFKPAVRMLPGARQVTVIDAGSEADKAAIIPASSATAHQLAAPRRGLIGRARIGLHPLQGTVHGPFIWLALSGNECRDATLEAAVPMHSWLRISSSK